MFLFPTFVQKQKNCKIYNIFVHLPNSKFLQQNGKIHSNVDNIFSNLKLVYPKIIKTRIISCRHLPRLESFGQHLVQSAKRNINHSNIPRTCSSNLRSPLYLTQTTDYLRFKMLISNPTIKRAGDPVDQKERKNIRSRGSRGTPAAPDRERVGVNYLERGSFREGRWFTG